MPTTQLSVLFCPQTINNEHALPHRTLKTKYDTKSNFKNFLNPLPPLCEHIVIITHFITQRTSHKIYENSRNSSLFELQRNYHQEQVLVRDAWCHK